MIVAAAFFDLLYVQLMVSNLDVILHFYVVNKDKDI
jgi:hypothetical protein